MAVKALAERHLAYLRRGRYLNLSRSWQNRLEIRWADTLEDRWAAFSLVHDEYLRLGYIARPTPSKMMYRLHHVLPTSATLLLTDDSKVIGTLTHVLDTDLYGLPMDKIYHGELQALRRRGRRLAELSALAVRRDYCLQSLFMLLVRAAYGYALEQQVTDFCIMVHPRHAPFYRTVFLFEDLGPERPYPLVNAPAVALRADLLTFSKRLRDLLNGREGHGSLDAFLHQPWEEAAGWPRVHRRLSAPQPLSAKDMQTLLAMESAWVDDLDTFQRRSVNDPCRVPFPLH